LLAGPTRLNWQTRIPPPAEPLVTLFASRVAVKPRETLELSDYSKF